jgi:hypothetical protein
MESSQVFNVWHESPLATRWSCSGVYLLLSSIPKSIAYTMFRSQSIQRCMCTGFHRMSIRRHRHWRGSPQPHTSCMVSGLNFPLSSSCLQGTWNRHHPFPNRHHPFLQGSTSRQVGCMVKRFLCPQGRSSWQGIAYTLFRSQSIQRCMCTGLHRTSIRRHRPWWWLHEGHRSCMQCKLLLQQQQLPSQAANAYVQRHVLMCFAR